MVKTIRRPEPTTFGSGVHHFLTLASVGPAGLRALLDLAHRAKRDPATFQGSLAGGKVGMIFDKPSTRTRVSLEAAAWALGMLPVVLRPDELQLGRGETIGDTARVLSRYLDAVTVRTFAQSRVEELADGATIPIVNALTDEHHPCQALADLMTIEEAFGSLAGITLAYVGDGNNVCHSLIEGAALGGFRLRIGCPPGYEPDPAILEAALTIAAGTGGSVELFSDPAEAVAGADAVYTDVWASMGQDAEHDERVAAFGGVPGRRGAHGARRAARDLPPLPARPPRRGGRRRGDRRPGLAGLGPGREPAPHRARLALRGRRRRPPRQPAPGDGHRIVGWEPGPPRRLGPGAIGRR